MNTPYLWFNPRAISQKLVGTYNDAISPDRFLFIDAQPLKLRSPLPSFDFAVPHLKLTGWDVLPNNIRVPLITTRLATLLNNICKDDFQLIPTTIQTLDSVITDCFLLNIIAEVSGIDHAGSSFVMLPGVNEIMKVEQLRYRTGAMGRHHLARDREYEPFLWASDTVVHAFERAKIKGCAFEPPEYIHP